MTAFRAKKLFLAKTRHVSFFVAQYEQRISMVRAHYLELETEAPKDQILFLDRGVPDVAAYYRKFNLSSDEVLKNALASVRYREVFLLNMIEFVNDAERYETPQEAAILHRYLRDAYTEQGYDVIEVPVVPVPERADFILK